MAEEDLEMIYEEASEAMEKSVKSYRKDLLRVRTGRASTALLDGVMVDYYGSSTPLNQLANLSAPDPRLLVVAAFDKGALNDIEKAIQASELGLNPANDGKVIRISVPPLTEERRKELVKQVRSRVEDARVAVRNVRRDGMDQIKKANADGMSEDEQKLYHDEIQELTDAAITKVDDALATKQEEIMQV